MTAWKLLFALLITLLGAGCPTKPDTTRGGEPCTRLGQTCTISNGLLGVCTPPAPGSCAREPCFVCMAQH